MASVTSSSTTTIIHNMIRKRMVACSFLKRSKSIAPAPNGVDERLFAPLLQLSAQTIDVYFNNVRGPFPVRCPQVLAEHLSRHDLSGMTHQHLQNAEFGRRQIDFVAAATDAARSQIERQL